MPENNTQTEPVDGFADNMAEQKLPTHGEVHGIPGAPDPGPAKGALEPLSPEEFARLKKEAAAEDSVSGR
jgi:hypothetical protein